MTRCHIDRPHPEHDFIRAREKVHCDGVALEVITPGGQAYHTHLYNRTTMPTGEALDMLNELHHKLADMGFLEIEGMDEAIHEVAFHHGIRMA